MAEEVYLITSNPDKVQSAEAAFADTGIHVKQFDADIPEIQAADSVEVAKHTVLHVIDSCNIPVIREDHSLYLDAIPGFPGPYISYFDEHLPAEQLLQLLESTEERTGYFEIGTVLGYPDGEITAYTFQIPIRIAEEMRGTHGNWDRVMMLRDSDQSFSESDETSRLDMWNRNYRKIAEDLRE